MNRIKHETHGVCWLMMASALAIAGTVDPCLAQAESEPETVETIPVNPSVESEATTPEEKRPSGSRLVEEIVVTAEKREESINDVPISISAFSAGKLDAKGIIDTGDLPKITPGLTVTSQLGFTSIFLRGVGSDVYFLGDPSVAIYVDDVYFPFSQGIVQDLGVIDRVEVLKGPQGTLFGRNALGGALRIISSDPPLEDPQASGQALYGSDSLYSGRARIGIPLISDTLGISVAGYYNQSDDYRSGFTGVDRSPLNGITSEGFNAKALWRVADWLDARVAFYNISKNADSSLFLPNSDPSQLGTLAGITPQNPRDGAYVNGPTYHTVDNSTAYGGLHFMLSAFDLKLLGSDQKIRNTQATDLDGSPQSIASAAGGTFLNAKTAEVQLLSNDSTPLSDWLTWVAGTYYFASKGGIYLDLVAAETNLANNQIYGIQLPVDIFDLTDVVPLPSGQVFATGTLETDSLAYFAQATVHMTDWADLILGGRYQEERRRVDESLAGIRMSDGSVMPYLDLNYKNTPSLSTKTKSFDPKIGFSLRPTADFLGIDPLIYLSYQTATKTATFNVVNITQAPTRVMPEELTAYELGGKFRWLDGIFQLNPSVFHYTTKRPQVQTISLTNGGVVTFENAGEARVVGLDIDSQLLVLPELTDDGLVFTFSACYLKSEYTSYRNGYGFNESTGIGQDGNDFTGNDVVRSPKWSGTAGLSYTMQAPGGPVELGTSYYFNSGFYYLAQNTPNVEEKAFQTLDANISYLYAPWNVRITAFGKNILREDYNQSRFTIDFGTYNYVAPLDTYGIRLNYDF